MRAARWASVAVVALMWVAVATAGSGASGSITVDGTTLEPTWAVAVPTVGGWPEGPLVRVYLVPSEVDLTGVMEAINVAEAVAARLGDDYAYVTFTPAGEVVNVGAVFEGYRNFGFEPPRHEGTALADARVRGRVFTEGQKELMDSVYTFDLTFDATLIQPPEPTATLAADGGAPGKCYREYLRGVREGEVALLKTYGAATLAEEIAAADEYTLEYLVSGQKDYAPQEMEIDGGADYGAYAILQVHGRDWSGDKVRGAVKMVRDGDSWRYAEEALNTVWDE